MPRSPSQCVPQKSKPRLARIDRGTGYLKRAGTDRLHEIFLKFATVEKNGERFITSEDFESVELIAGIVDMDKNGLISFPEFQAFEGLLCVPDALYKTAFQLFDTNGNGLSTFVRLYFGKDKKRLVTYPEFSQFLHDFHEEYGVEAFKKCDKDGTGFISTGDFKNIMLSVKSHLLTKDLKNKATGFPQGSRMISFPYYMAFTSLLNNMELIKRVYLNATNGHRSQEVTKEEFLHSAQMMSQITPLEVDILFFLLIESKQTVGASAVYPIDLVKTRMQNQRTGSFIGEVAYRNSFDCFKKVIRHEGIFGLYRGLVPQLIGVAPEKAIKLTVNDLVRDKFMDKNGNISIYAEILAGACAGGSQVVFTNPLEIVKIRLQVAGEIAGGGKVRALTVAKFADENGYNHPLTLLAAGAIAGVPAAYLVTPADVIKTRLQVVARTGQTTYSGLLDAAGKIYREEGFRARPTGSELNVSTPIEEIMKKPHHIGGYQVALPVLTGLETKFGISLPRFSFAKPAQ
ncbi:hypothetical protein MSG28_002643 [Choristoneura fumiferana]|uniref:Uncharacterized protein n=1 Tax=Choristoneura fumiferana TaxID=7141 RepID=A0ACC0JIQ5_CHOFU|nr:hypothetical protein MSG28_002643 [Choristoneura fumiferana]